MPRPKDLPQPVREHPSHENLMEKWKAAEAPGPGTYPVHDPRESKMTSFSKAIRFRKGMLYPGDLRTTQERDDALCSPGPAYNPPAPRSNIAVSMTKGDRFTAHQEMIPGPGEYQPGLDWSKGVSFLQAGRAPTRFTEHTPTCTTYNPQLLKKHIAGGNFYKAQSTFFKKSRRLPDDEPKLISLAAIDRATNYIKMPFQSVGFTKAKRFGWQRSSSAAPLGGTIGPGAYNVDLADAHRFKTGRAVGFGQGKLRRHLATGGEGGPFVDLPPSDVESAHTKAPSIGFTKASYRRGIPVEADLTIPAPKYYPPADLDDRRKIATSFGTSPRMPPTQDMTPGPGPAPEGLDLGTTVGEGPQITFPTSSRNPTSFRRLMDTAPGPGSYSIRDRRRPDSAGQTFTRSRRPDVRVQSGASTEGVPGAKYNPDISPTRPRSAQNVYIHRSARKLGSATPQPGVDVGPAYTPRYNVIDKDPRAAILYLTG